MSEPDPRPRNIILAQADRRAGADPNSAPEVNQVVEKRMADAVPPTGDIMEMVRSLVMAALQNNVTINGVSPEVSGGQINFPAFESKSAAEKFAEANQPKPIDPPKLTLEERLQTPNLDAPVGIQRGPYAGLGQTEQERSPVAERLSKPIGIRRGAYAGLGQKTRPPRIKPASKLKQSERNHKGKDPDVPAKTELPNKVTERDMSRDAKSFVRMLVERADGEIKSLINVDVSSAANVYSDDDLPAASEYYKAVGGKDLDLRINYVELAGGSIILDFYEFLCWRGGLFVGHFTDGTQPDSTDLITQDVSFIAV